MATGLPKLSITTPAILVLGLVSGASTYAQVATDGTVGPRVRLGGPDFQIGADLGTRAGRNLFHSFERFSLDAGERATFSGPDQIRRVISRVTGGTRSDIDGVIRSTIPGADFYFLNPAGVVFGPNARLDLQGSFHVSTADELRFTDGAKFSATDPAASSFTVAAPEAFGFLGPSRGPILVDQSVLEVPTGKSLSIVGGDIDITGGSQSLIRAAAGQITLAAVDSPGEARLKSGDMVADGTADIRLIDRALLDTSGDGGGTIYIRGSNFLVGNQSRVVADNSGALNAVAGVDVEAHRVQVTRGSALSTDARGSGTGGAIFIRADELEISDRGKLTADTRDTGTAGVVAVTARDIDVRRGGFLRSSTFGDGAAGAVFVDAARLHISRDGSDQVTGVLSDANAAGNGGRVVVNAQDLDLRAGGELSSSTFSEGNAGEVAVTAERMQIHSGGRITSSTSGDGRGGLIRVSAGDFAIRGGEIGSSTSGRGNAGRVAVVAQDVEINAGGRITSSTSGEGGGGSIRVSARDLRIRGSVISSSARGDGDAGAVALSASHLKVDRSRITADSFASGGANVAIDAQNLVDLQDSIISTAFLGTTIGARAGSIAIEADSIILDRMRILTTALFSGNVNLSGFGIFSPDTIISVGFALTGQDLTELASNNLIIGGLVILKKPDLEAEDLLRERCEARRDIGASTFTAVGRGGLPPSPDGPLVSAYVGDEAAVGAARRAGSVLTTVIAPADVRLAGLSAPCAPLD